MHDEICYEDPFLKDVIARIDFVVPLEGLEKTLPSKLANVISEDFPISEPVDAISQELQISGEGVKHRQSQFKQWNFYGREREKQLSIAAQFIFLTYKKYTAYEDMKRQFEKVIDELNKTFPDTNIKRFGLRYINIIEIQELPTPLSWDNYISPGLLENLKFFIDPNPLIRLIQIAELKYEDLIVRFQFGMPNPDYPAIMKRPQFVLDLDAYVQTAHGLRDSLLYIDQAHERIQVLFERSITDPLRRRMNVRERVPIQE